MQMSSNKDFRSLTLGSAHVNVNVNINVTVISFCNADQLIEIAQPSTKYNIAPLESNGSAVIPHLWS